MEDTNHHTLLSHADTLGQPRLIWATFRCLESVLLVPRVVLYLSVYKRPTSYVLRDESHIRPSSKVSLLFSRSSHCSLCRVAEGGSLAILCSYSNTPNACHPAPMLPWQ